MIETLTALSIVFAAILSLRLLLPLLRACGLASAGGSQRALRVMETAALGARQRLHVVEVDGERLLLGCTEGSVRLLRRLPPAAPTLERDAVRDAPEEVSTDAASWLQAPALRAWVRRLGGVALLAGLLAAVDPGAAAAAPTIDPATIKLSLEGLSEPERVSSTLEIVGLLTLVSVAPSLLLMMTCFTRILVVMSLVRQAVGVHQLPPNQVLVGLALFTTLFVMAPIGKEINENALQPYVAREIEAPEAFELAVAPVRNFLLEHTRERDLELFVSLSDGEPPATLADASMFSLLPAFMISELRVAFEIGFMIYLPFLVIDIVIASMLISMGMIVLPPMMIALPFKLMLFVLLDGWNLVIRSLVSSI